jgi:hypothetical protein
MLQFRLLLKITEKRYSLEKQKNELGLFTGQGAQVNLKDCYKTLSCASQNLLVR